MMYYSILLLVFCVAACLFAVARGGMPERIAATVVLVNLLTATTNYSTYHNLLIDLCIDVVTAFALLPVTLRYASAWLGAIMMVYALQFGMDGYYLVLDLSIDSRAHALINNLNSAAISIALATATVIAWMREREPAGMAPGLLHVAK